MIPEYFEILECIGLKLQNVLPEGLTIELCKYRAYNAVLSFLYDKERYKDFHGSEQPNNIKKTAYLCHWIAKIRPFYITVDKSIIEGELCYIFPNFINSYACIFVYQLLVNSSMNTLPDSFIYDCHYGSPTSSSLIAMFDIAGIK